MRGAPDDRLDAEIKQMLDAFEGPASPQPRPSKGRRRLLPRMAAMAAGSVVIALVIAGIWVFGNGGERRRAALGPSGSCNELRIGPRRYVARRVSPALMARSTTVVRGTVAVCSKRSLREPRAFRLVGVDPRVAVVRAAAPETVYVASTSRCVHARTDADLVGCLASSGR